MDEDRYSPIAECGHRHTLMSLPLGELASPDTPRFWRVRTDGVQVRVVPDPEVRFAWLARGTGLRYDQRDLIASSGYADVWDRFYILDGPLAGLCAEIYYGSEWTHPVSHDLVAERPGPQEAPAGETHTGTVTFGERRGEGDR